MSISVSGYKYQVPGQAYYEFEGESTDEKPVGLLDGWKIITGSKFIEWDTGKMYRYDAEEKSWKAFGGDA